MQWSDCVKNAPAPDSAMIEFLKATLTPEVFWTALASIGTLFAVLVALFMPGFRQYRRNNRIKRHVLAEMQENMRIIRNMTLEDPKELPDEHNGIKHIGPDVIMNSLTERIDLSIWRQYRYELAEYRPKSYEKYQSVNRFAEAIIGTLFDPTMNQTMRLAVQKGEAISFISEYEKLNKKRAASD